MDLLASGRHQGDPHRPEPRDGDRPGRRAPVRDHHVAAGRRHRRPPCRGGVHRRFRRGRGSARLHDQRHELRWRREAARSRWVVATISSPAGSVSWASRAADRRGLSAHPPLLPLPRPLRTWAGRRGSAGGLRGARGRHRPPLGRAGPAGTVADPRRSQGRSDLAADGVGRGPRSRGAGASVRKHARAARRRLSGGRSAACALPRWSGRRPRPTRSG